MDEASGVPAPDVPAYDWLHFVARSSDEGRRWVENYRRLEVLDTDRLAALALLDFREGRQKSGAARLKRISKRLRDLELSSSIRAVLNRWYHGVVAYDRYCREDFDGAGESLDLANAAVTTAVSEQRELLLLANHCQEFRLHHARIARNRRRWKEMEHHVEVARSMVESQSPLCILSNRSAVFMTDIQNFIYRLDLDDKEREFLKSLLDDKLRLMLFDRFVTGLQMIPGFVIPYRS